MRPTLRQMQYVIAVAETGRFHEAAKRVNISQPSLSAQIADVERSLNIQLFERSRSGATTTELGNDFVRRARSILHDVEALRTAMEEGIGKLSGVVRIGAIPSIGPYLLPPVVQQLRQHDSGLQLHVQEMRPPELNEHLTSGDIDVIISSPEDHPNTLTAPLFTETLWICGAPSDPLAGKGPVEMDVLKDRTLLAVGVGHRLRMITQQIADASGASIDEEFTGTSFDAVRQMASIGPSLTILPSLYALTEARRDQNLVLRRINDPLAERDIALIWRASSPLSEWYRDLASTIRAEAERLLEPGKDDFNPKVAEQS